MIVRLGYISQPGKRFSQRLAVINRFRTLQYRSEGFGAATQPRSPAQDYRCAATLEILGVE